jgi:hypothetical protein
MIEFRFKQRWYKGTCECDRSNNWGKMQDEHGDHAAIIRIGCPVCSHYHCVPFSEFGTREIPRHHHPYFNDPRLGRGWRVRVKKDGKEIYLSRE